jgi:predicted nucleotidyltransferase
MPGPGREQTIAALERFFASRAPDSVVAAWLFGSVALDTAGADSDVDVAVLYAEDPGSALDAGPLDLEGDLEHLLCRETQVIVMNRAPADLTHRVLRDGVLVFEADRTSRVRFEVRTRNEYFDLLPHLQRYRRRA